MANTATRYLIGFGAGFLAVPLFHQGMLLLLNLVGLIGAPPWPMAPRPPFGVPAVISASFWGGVWGLVFVALEARLTRGAGYWLGATLFGAVAVSLVAWFVAFPLKGQAVAGGFRPAALAAGLLVNGAWGFGTALLSRLAPARPARGQTAASGGG